MRAGGGARVPAPSRRLLALFAFYLRWYLRRHFHALRLAHGERFAFASARPLVVYLNHASWWDPLACILISRRFLRRATHYAPMDEAALARYGFFAKLGLFPVEMNTPRGALQFLRASKQVLSTPNSVLWLTPEGRFTDPRRQPPVFKEGLATLLTRLPSAILLPVAIEYVFWDERLPEILVNCGEPVSVEGGENNPAQWNELLSSSLAATQRELAAFSIARDPSPFESLLSGAAGVGAFYDIWQRLRSAFRGDRYDPEHGSIHHP